MTHVQYVIAAYGFAGLALLVLVAQSIVAARAARRDLAAAEKDDGA